MTVPAQSYEAAASAALVAMLADSPTWRALVGAVGDDATQRAAARARIVEDDAGADAVGHVFRAVDGDALGATCPVYASVRLDDCRRPQRALLTWGHEGEATITVFLRATPGDLPACAIRRARNAAGSIAADLHAQCGQPDKHLSLAAHPAAPHLCDDGTGALAGFVAVTLSIDWSDLP